MTTITDVIFSKRNILNVITLSGFLYISICSIEFLKSLSWFGQPRLLLLNCIFEERTLVYRTKISFTKNVMQSNTGGPRYPRIFYPRIRLFTFEKLV